MAKVTGRLCQSDHLHKYRLPGRGVYFVLGTTGARLLGVPRHRTQPLGPQTLPVELAALWYAVGGSRTRVRLTHAEFQERYTELLHIGRGDIYCGPAPHSDQQHIELVRVDRGTSADHVARKCERFLDTRCNVPPFAALVRVGQLRLVVLTATAEKCQALRAAFGRRDWPVGLQLHLVVLPMLLSVLGGQSDAA